MKARELALGAVQVALAIGGAVILARLTDWSGLVCFGVALAASYPLTALVGLLLAAVGGD